MMIQEGGDYRIPGNAHEGERTAAARIPYLSTDAPINKLENWLAVLEAGRARSGP